MILVLKNAWENSIRQVVLEHNLSYEGENAGQSVSQSVTIHTTLYHTPSRELMDHTHSTVLLFRVR